jgi:hypothetical protein
MPCIALQCDVSRAVQRLRISQTSEPHPARGEALLNEFAEIVKSSRRQKMKGSHVKRQLAQVADHWCHRCA